MKDARKSNFLMFSAPGGGGGQVLCRLVSQPGVTEGNPRKKVQNKFKPRRGDRNVKDRGMKKPVSLLSFRYGISIIKAA